MIDDFRTALRTLVKNPAFSAVAVLSLALGIGANTAIFTVLDAVLLRMLPVRSPQELYVVGSPRERGGLGTTWNYPDYAAFRDHNTAFSGLAAYSGTMPLAFSAQGDGAGQPAAPAYGLMVSGNYFEVLGVEPVLGRVLNPQDDVKAGGGPYLVLGYVFWKRRFAADPRVIGATAPGSSGGQPRRSAGHTAFFGGR